MFPTQKNFGL